MDSINSEKISILTSVENYIQNFIILKTGKRATLFFQIKTKCPLKKQNSHLNANLIQQRGHKNNTKVINSKLYHHMKSGTFIWHLYFCIHILINKFRAHKDELFHNLKKKKVRLLLPNCFTCFTFKVEAIIIIKSIGHRLSSCSVLGFELNASHVITVCILHMRKQMTCKGITNLPQQQRSHNYYRIELDLEIGSLTSKPHSSKPPPQTHTKSKIQHLFLFCFKTLICI